MKSKQLKIPTPSGSIHASVRCAEHSQRARIIASLDDLTNNEELVRRNALTEYPHKRTRVKTQGTWAVPVANYNNITANDARKTFAEEGLVRPLCKEMETRQGTDTTL